MDIRLERESKLENVNIGDILVSANREYFIVTAYSVQKGDIEIKALDTLYTVGEYGSIAQLNYDIEEEFFENKHTGNISIREVIKSKDVIITRKEE